MIDYTYSQLLYIYNIENSDMVIYINTLIHASGMQFELRTGSCKICHL